MMPHVQIRHTASSRNMARRGCMGGWIVNATAADEEGPCGPAKSLHIAAHTPGVAAVQMVSLAVTPVGSDVPVLPLHFDVGVGALARRHRAGSAATVLGVGRARLRFLLHG